MHARDRATRAAQHAVLVRGQCNGGPVVAFLDARGHEPDDAVVPVVVMDDQCAGVGSGFTDQRQRLFAHVAFQVASLLVDLVQFGGQLGGAGQVGGQQAFHADRHVGQSAGGIDARADGKTQVGGSQRVGAAAGHLQQGSDAGAGSSGTNARQPRVDDDAVVVGERHHIGHGAQRRQVHERRQRRRRPVEAPQLAAVTAQRDQHIEHDAHTGQVLVREGAAGLVGVDDGQRGRQRLGRQVVVGDDDRQAEAVGMFDTGDRGDAVVDGEQQGWPAQTRVHQRGIHHFRGEAIAVLEAVGHQVVDGGAHHPKALHRDGDGRGAVAVVVAHHQDRLLVVDGTRQPGHGFGQTPHRVGGQQARQIQPDLVRMADAAGGQQSGQQRIDTGLQQRLAGAQVNRAGVQPKGGSGRLGRHGASSRKRESRGSAEGVP